MLILLFKIQISISFWGTPKRKPSLIKILYSFLVIFSLLPRWLVKNTLQYWFKFVAVPIIILFLKRQLSISSLVILNFLEFLIIFSYFDSEMYFLPFKLVINLLQVLINTFSSFILSSLVIVTPLFLRHLSISTLGIFKYSLSFIKFLYSNLVRTFLPFNVLSIKLLQYWINLSPTLTVIPFFFIHLSTDFL